jgi:hypothetical protein
MLSRLSPNSALQLEPILVSCVKLCRCSRFTHRATNVAAISGRLCWLPHPVKSMHSVSRLLDIPVYRGVYLEVHSGRCNNGPDSNGHWEDGVG